MSTVNIMGTFSKEAKPRNGLVAIVDQLIDEELLHAEYVIVATIRPKRVATEAEDGVRTATIRFDHIEVMQGQGAIDSARALLTERFQDRTGHEPQLEMDFGVPGPDGEREVPEASAEELLAERREAREGGGSE